MRYLVFILVGPLLAKHIYLVLAGEIGTRYSIRATEMIGIYAFSLFPFVMFAFFDAIMDARRVPHRFAFTALMAGVILFAFIRSGTAFAVGAMAAGVCSAMLAEEQRP